WLSPLEPCTRHQEIRSKRLKDTGSWFLNTPEFQTWYRLVYNNEMLDNNPHPALACYGLPGAGKSVMSSLVIDRLSQIFSNNGNQFRLAYVYCDYQDKARQTAAHIIGALLKQLIPISWDEI
ncbi:hypothetical protein FPQ18DRAFT_239586, partial [Pyronema domesticum]